MRLLLKRGLAAAFLLHTFHLTAQPADDMVAAMADSVMQLKIFQHNHKLLKKKQVNKYNYAPDSVPQFSEEVIQARMDKINARSPIRLDYNDKVAGYVEMYTLRRREQVERMLGLAQLYYPLFEEKLDLHGLPMELKHLAVVESALNASAKSRAGAVGLWQFMYGTGKMFGLEVNSYVDERSDPVKSTEAACRYLKYLYNMFNDWHLALAAYNAGPGTVNKAIRRSGGRTNYWELMPYLPRETNGYVPAFIAANYIMNHYQEHNLYPNTPKFFFNQVDTIYVREELSLAQVADFMSVDIEELRFLNPALKHDVIPAYEGAVPLCIPSYCTGFVLGHEEDLYTINKQAEAETKVVDRTPEERMHVVRRGEYLSLIAMKYNCSVTDIRNWNNLRSNAIHPGQRLKLYPEGPAVASKPAVRQAVTGSVKVYTVQPGDTLWDIANKYKGISVEDLIRLNNIRNGDNLTPGMKIKITAS